MEREEFINRLDQIFCWSCKYTSKELLNALLSNDTDKLQQIRDLKSSLDSQMQAYIDSFDAAQTDEDRMSVVGSVSAPQF